MTYIRHYINEMDESQIQQCIYCGELITDYINIMYEGSEPPKGFAGGNIFVRNGFPKIITTIEPDNHNPCN